MQYAIQQIGPNWRAVEVDPDGNPVWVPRSDRAGRVRRWRLTEATWADSSEESEQLLTVWLAKSAGLAAA